MQSTQTAQASLLKLNRRAAALHCILAIGILTVTLIKWETTFRFRLTQPELSITRFSQCQRDCYATNPAFDNLNNVQKQLNTEKVYTTDRSILAVPIGVLVTAFAIITAAFHIGLATRYRDTYLRWVFQEQRQPARWVEYSITASLMTCIVASLCDVKDANTQLGIFMMTVATMLTGYSIEVSPKIDGGLSSSQWGWFAVGMAFFVVTWVIILLSYARVRIFLETQGRRLVKLLDPLIDFPPEVQKDPSIPAFVDWTTINIVILFLLFAVVCLISQNVRGWSSTRAGAFVKGERYFVMLSFISKAFLVIMLGSAALRDDAPSYMA